MNIKDLLREAHTEGYVSGDCQIDTREEDITELMRSNGIDEDLEYCINALLNHGPGTAAAKHTLLNLRKDKK